MRWSVFCFFLLVVIVLDHGLGALVALGDRHVVPDLLLIYAVFIGMHASRGTVAWAFVIIGLLTDLTHPVAIAEGGGSVAIIGPATLGYMVAAWAMSHLRGLVYRDSLAAMAVLVLAVGVVINLVTVAMLSFRGLPWPLAEPLAGWHASEELVYRFFVLIYSTLLSLPIGYLLSHIERLWSFDPGKTKGGRAAG